MTYTIIYYLQPKHSSCSCNDHDHDHHHEYPSDEKLVGNIKELGPWACFMPDSYLVKSDLSANEILEKLKPTIGEKDLLFVTKVTSESSASMTPEVIDWINK